MGMKSVKKIFCMIIISVSLVGCGKNESVDIGSVIEVEDTISEVTVKSYSGGGVEESLLSEEERLEFELWISEMVVEKVEVSEEENPENYNGGICYTFSSDDFISFSYFDMGEGEGYIRMVNNWYKVIE